MQERNHGLRWPALDERLDAITRLAEAAHREAGTGQAP
jgi:hypothetical protein